MSAESIDVVAGIIRDGNRYLVSKRPEDTHLAGYWEFPGGKPEPGESDREALVRELQEELGVQVTVGQRYFSVTHDYEQRTVRLRFYHCSLTEQSTPEPVECAEVKWVSERDITSLDFPPADEPLLEKITNPEDRERI